MGSFSIWHWLVVLLIVILVFGTKKLRNIGQDLGSAIRGFKEGLKSGESEGEKTEGAVVAKEAGASAASNPSATPASAPTAMNAAAPNEATVIEGQIREKRP